MHNTSPDPSDNELIGRIQARDEAAFELLYARYGEPLQRHLCGMLRAETAPEAAAQDLAQEVFLRVWTRAEQWSGVGSFRGWLYRIATNLALNHLRSARRHPAQPLAEEDHTQWDEWSDERGAAGEAVPPAPGWLVDSSALGPDAALEQAEFNARLQQAINGLPEEKRAVLRLVHEMELSIHDAAGRLGIPEGTVKSRLHYAEKRFSASWHQMSGEDDV